MPIFRAVLSGIRRLLRPQGPQPNNVQGDDAPPDGSAASASTGLAQPGRRSSSRNRINGTDRAQSFWGTGPGPGPALPLNRRQWNQYMDSPICSICGTLIRRLYQGETVLRCGHFCHITCVEYINGSSGQTCLPCRDMQRQRLQRMLALVGIVDVPPVEQAADAGGDNVHNPEVEAGQVNLLGAGDGMVAQEGEEEGNDEDMWFGLEFWL